MCSGRMRVLPLLVLFANLFFRHDFFSVVLD